MYLCHAEWQRRVHAMRSRILPGQVRIDCMCVMSHGHIQRKDTHKDAQSPVNPSHMSRIFPNQYMYRCHIHMLIVCTIHTRMRYTCDCRKTWALGHLIAAKAAPSGLLNLVPVQRIAPPAICVQLVSTRSAVPQCLVVSIYKIIAWFHLIISKLQKWMQSFYIELYLLLPYITMSVTI